MEILWQDEGRSAGAQVCVAARHGRWEGGGKVAVKRWPPPLVARPPPAGCRKPGSGKASGEGGTAAWPCSCGAPEQAPIGIPQSCSTSL